MSFFLRSSKKSFLSFAFLRLHFAFIITAHSYISFFQKAVLQVGGFAWGFYLTAKDPNGDLPGVVLEACPSVLGGGEGGVLSPARVALGRSLPEEDVTGEPEGTAEWVGVVREEEALVMLEGLVLEAGEVEDVLDDREEDKASGELMGGVGDGVLEVAVGTMLTVLLAVLATIVLLVTVLTVVLAVLMLAVVVVLEANVALLVGTLVLAGAIVVD